MEEDGYVDETLEKYFGLTVNEIETISKELNIDTTGKTPRDAALQIIVTQSKKPKTGKVIQISLTGEKLFSVEELTRLENTRKEKQKEFNALLRALQILKGMSITQAERNVESLQNEIQLINKKIKAITSY